MKRLFKIFIIVALILFLQADGTNASNNKVPNVAVYNLDGVRFILYSILDKIPEDGLLIINFTSIHCKPCQKEIPELVRIAKISKDIICMFIFNETPSEVTSTATRFGIYDNSYCDSFGSMQLKFNVKSYPVTVVVSKNRGILGRFEGLILPHNSTTCRFSFFVH